MVSPDVYSELLISDTLVPDIFIVRYLPALSKDAVALYLWTRMTYKGGSFTLKEAFDFGLIPEEDIKTALAELVSAGVLIRGDKDVFEPVDLKKTEVIEFLNIRTDLDGEPVMRSDEKSRNLLAKSVNKTFYQGRMPNQFYKLIDKCLYEYKFESQVVYALFEEGKELRVQYIVPKMYDLAATWYEKGYTSTEALKDYYELRGRRDEVTKLVGRMLHKHLNEIDYERINKWTGMYGADAAIVEYAIRVNDWRNSIRPVDIEQTLKEWFDAGAMTIDKAAVFEAERHKENKAKASRNKGRTNVRKSGKEAGITVDKSGEDKDPPKPQSADAHAVHDSILDMFAEDDDEDDN